MKVIIYIPNQGSFGDNLKGGPQNQKEIEAFDKFQKTVAPISTFLGTRTEVNIKTWN